MESRQFYVRTNSENLSYRPSASADFRVQAPAAATAVNEYSGTEHVLPSLSRSSRTYSTVSSSSSNSDYGSFLSHRSSTSRSSISSTDAPPFDQTFRFLLCCEFGFLGCEVAFPPDQSEAWISHCQSHFQHVGPPRYTICTFCDGEEGQFDTQHDLVANWKSRMMHIKDHLERESLLRPPRPDFYIVEHLRENDLLSVEDYLHVMEYTERPSCEGILHTESTSREKNIVLRSRQEKVLQQPHNLRKERREMKERDKKRRSEGRGKATY